MPNYENIIGRELFTPPSWISGGSNSHAIQHLTNISAADTYAQVKVDVG